MKPRLRSISWGERSGVRASVLLLSGLTTVKKCAQLGPETSRQNCRLALDPEWGFSSRRLVRIEDPFPPLQSSYSDCDKWSRHLLARVAASSPRQLGSRLALGSNYLPDSAI